MISSEERAILQLISKKLLIKKSELARLSNGLTNTPLEKSIEFLKDNGYIDIVAPLGETSLAITQKGMRTLSERQVNS